MKHPKLTSEYYKLVKVKRCTDCSFFEYGMNDPQCYHPNNSYESGVRRRVYPNSGANADRGPPKKCPLRSHPYTVSYRVEEVYDEA